MVFHRFQQLPAELRLQVWEYALSEALVMDGLLTDNQKPICHIIAPRRSPGSPLPSIKLVTFQDASLAHVCHESREVLRRCGQFGKARDYNPSTDVLYVDNYYDLLMLPHKLKLKIRHVAFSADICYKMLTAHATGQRRSHQRSLPGENCSYTPLCLAGIESVTIVLPPLEKSMTYYADQAPVAMRPSFLRTVPYSEVQRIKIKGPYAYKSWLRGSSNAKRRFLGPIIKDVNEIWKCTAKFMFHDDNERQEMTVQAGVLQYLEGPFQGKMRLSPIYKGAEDLEEGQATDPDLSLS